MAVNASLSTRKLGSRNGRAGRGGALARGFFSINWLLLINVALLIVIGLVVVYSATRGRPQYSFSRQFTGVFIGVAGMLVIWLIDYRQYENWWVFFLIVTVLLSVSSMIPGLGVEVLGGDRWIVIFGQRIQPSEFAKLPAIITMASLVAPFRGKLQSAKQYLKCICIMLIPMFCVMMQPDLGTALVFLMIGMTVLFTGGANRWWIIITVVIGAAVIGGVLILDPILDEMLGRDVLLQQYQVNRLLVFLNEDLDPKGLGYNLRQAKIAIGSGGWTGVGFMQGTQSGLGFLPEAPTDFIFCVLAEEFGFMGSLALIGLYSTLVLFSIRIAMRADAFGALLTSGCVGMWVFQILENIGMTCGMMPITGIPLPFISYGSSSMLLNLCAVGLIASVGMRTNLRAQEKPSLA